MQSCDFSYFLHLLIFRLLSYHFSNIHHKSLVTWALEQQFYSHILMNNRLEVKKFVIVFFIFFSSRVPLSTSPVCAPHSSASSCLCSEGFMRSVSHHHLGGLLPSVLSFVPLSFRHNCTKVLHAYASLTHCCILSPEENTCRWGSRRKQQFLVPFPWKGCRWRQQICAFCNKCVIDNCNIYFYLHALLLPEAFKPLYYDFLSDTKNQVRRLTQQQLSGSPMFLNLFYQLFSSWAGSCSFVMLLQDIAYKRE